MSRFSRICSVLCLSVAGLAAASCSAFDEDWNNTPPLVRANPAALMAGKWEGSWQSDATDYHGKMEAMITPKGVTVEDNKTVQKYEMRLRFRWYAIGFDEYSVMVNAVKGADNRLHFSGKKDLGIYRGGTMRYKGYVDPEKDILYLDYDSDKDVGTYKLSRVVQENM